MDSFGSKNTDRKLRKPLMERKRRARINGSLEQLKQTLLQNTVAITQGARPTKIEKADILEMTVRYIQVLHKQLSIVNPINDCVPSTTADSTVLASAEVPNKKTVTAKHLVLCEKIKKCGALKSVDNNKENCIGNNNTDKFKVPSGSLQTERIIFRTLSNKNTQSDDKDSCWRPW